MTMALARIQWPERVLAGDVVKVRLLVQHPWKPGICQTCWANWCHAM